MPDSSSVQMDKTRRRLHRGPCSPAVSIDQKSTNRNPRVDRRAPSPRCTTTCGLLYCPRRHPALPRVRGEADRTARPRNRSSGPGGLAMDEGLRFQGAGAGGADPQGRVRRPLRPNSTPRATAAVPRRLRGGALIDRPAEAQESRKKNTTSKWSSNRLTVSKTTAKQRG